MKRTIVWIVVLFAAACTPPEEKVNKLITTAMTKCQAAEGYFYEVEVVGGKDKVLRDVCALPIENLEIIEEYSAKATVGPYHVNAGIDSATGVWMLSGMSWQPLDKARKTTMDDAEIGARQKGLAYWDEVQKALPDSRYIREQRWKNGLELRRKTRGKDKNPLGLGTAKAMFDEMVKWGKEKDPEFAELVKVDVVEYHKNQSEKLEMSLENIGSQDGHLEALVRQARKEGNSEDAEKYQKELDDSIAGRDAKIERIETRSAEAMKNACAAVKNIDTSKIKDADLKKRANGVRTGLSCP